MAFSDELLDAGTEIWEAQYEHPFVTELADGTLDPDAFRHWVEQDYRYLLDYARTFAIAATKARREERMAGLLNVAHTTLDIEMDLHRSFAADYGISREDLDSTQKAPTCVAYTNFLVRTAHEGTLPEIAAAVYPCGQGYLDVAEHMAERADEEHRYTPFIEMYTSDEFYEVADWMRALVDDCAERNPGEREAMREAFLTSARLEHEFWEMCYAKEGWSA
ncbi:transcription regulator [Halovivax asiaticus JCM 14624]|uniref:Transcription regulator n=1 Tax=Halovivax asiaticus JCM 14624 TaxID=1227490 RepID=M0BL48_9EURY|nr:thiaminase II [Halovivax asiaticus]ELZ11013.1 transcription regulator [Halovivax asiaticus JCM 14624]